MDFKEIMLEMLNNVKKNEITIFTESNEDNEILNKSKIGGKPYLPKDFVWPYYQELPLSFLAQINLEEVKSLDKDNLLPDKGMLYFFYELETEEWGYELKNKGCAKVFYYEDISNFELIDFPEDMEDYNIVPEFKVNFKSNISYPAYENFEKLNENDVLLEKYETFEGYDELYDDFFDNYCDFHEEYMDGLESHTKLLGYPDVVQNSMEEECVEVTRDFDMEAVKASPKKYKEEIKKAAENWILLFQMDTVETDDYELMFGDSGHIYFWIKKEDLKNKNFDNVWLILQSY